MVQKNKKNDGMHYGISIKWKLTIYLALFCLVILLFVWVLQIFLLNYFYERSKMREMTDTISEVEVGLEDEQLDYLITHLAHQSHICISVYQIENGIANKIATGDSSPNCIIHKLSGSYLTDLYEKAKQSQDGCMTDKIELGQLIGPINQIKPHEFESVPDSDANVLNETKNEISKRDKYIDLDRTNAIMVQAYEKNGHQYAIFLDAELEPLEATTNTLQTQFIWIIVVVLGAGVVLALILARSISKPIMQMNDAAKQLAHGKYDVEFSGNGFKEIRELSNSLNDSSHELSKVDALQKELIANISHDLRTPLTMIKGYAEVVRDIPGEDTPENMQVIIDETGRMSELVSDMLDLSKLQSGSRKMTPEAFDLTLLISEVLHRYEKFTAHDGFKIQFDQEGPHSFVNADRTMILQVVYNLVNNAINYSGDSKQVIVRETVKEGFVRISVVDFGEGIEESQIPLIWDRYYKVDKMHKRAMVGTGIGLSIVKKILLAHNAVFGVESTVGVGTTFWFELPCTTADPQN